MSAFKLLSVVKTNWIHLVGFYFCIESFMLINAVAQFVQIHQLKLLFGQALLPAIILLFGYGLVPLICFYIILILTDLILFGKTSLSVFRIILIEWVIIVPVFVYWTFVYHYWLWLVLVASFYVTQVMRCRAIGKAYDSSI